MKMVTNSKLKTADGGKRKQIHLADQLGHVAAHAEQMDAITDVFFGDQSLELTSATSLAD